MVSVENLRPALKGMFSLTAFAGRHFFAVATVMAIVTVLWTIGYFALLVTAMVTNSGMGSPLTYPLGLLGIFALGVIFGWLIFAPACAAGHLFTSLLRLPRLAALPVVLAAGFAASFTLSALWRWMFLTQPLEPLGGALKNYLLFLALPLAIYWTIIEGPWALVDLARRWWARHRNRRPETAKPLP